MAPKKRNGPSATTVIDPVEALRSLEHEMNRSKLVSSTFANMQLHVTQRTLESYQTINQKNSEKISELEATVEHHNKESLEVLHYLQQELVKKTCLVEELNKGLASARETLLVQADGMRSQFSNTLQEQELLAVDLRLEIQRLRQEVDISAKYRLEGEEMVQAHSHLLQSHADMVNKYEREITRLRFAMVEQKVRLRAAEEEMNEAFQTEVDARAASLVQQTSKKLFADNLQLGVNVQVLQGDVVGLVSLSRDLRESLNRAKLDAVLHGEIHHEEVRASATVHLQARSSFQKAMELERKLHELDKQYNTKMKELEASKNHTIEQLTAEVAYLKQLCQSERSTTKHVRTMANFVVNQRSALEQFFFDALEDVTQHGSAKVSPLLNSQPIPNNAASGDTKTNSFRGHEDDAVEEEDPLLLLRDYADKEGGFNPREPTQRREVYAGSLASGHGVYRRPQTSRRSVSTARKDGPRNEVLRIEYQTREGGAKCTTSATSNLKKNLAQTEKKSGQSSANVLATFPSLPWEDKEKIIRAMLYFINTHHGSNGGNTGNILNSAPQPPAAPSDIVQTPMDINNPPSLEVEEINMHSDRPPTTGRNIHQVHCPTISASVKKGDVHYLPLKTSRLGSAGSNNSNSNIPPLFASPRLGSAASRPPTQPGTARPRIVHSTAKVVDPVVER